MPIDRILLSGDILARLRAREAAAYDELVERVGPGLVRVAAQLLQSTDAAEDIVQDVLYRVWQQGPDFNAQGTIVAYLFTAVRNRALNLIRDERARAVSRDTWAAETLIGEQRPLIPAADRRLEAEEDRDRLRQAIATLTELQRTAFALRYDQGLSIPEIATVFGTSVRAVEQLMARARRMLRERLLAEEPPAP